jgi:hypothetical protein
MKIELIIIFLLIVILLYFNNKKSEHITPLYTLSNESIQNIASIYSNSNDRVVFNNLKILKNLEVDISANIINANINNANIDNANIKSGNIDNAKILKSLQVDSSANIMNAKINNVNITSKLTMDDTGIFSSRILPGFYTKNVTWDFPSFGRAVVKKFKRTDPDGSVIFAALHVDDYVWIVGYIKVGNAILLFKLQQHSNISSIDDGWRFTIPE